MTPGGEGRSNAKLGKVEKGACSGGNDTKISDSFTLREAGTGKVFRLRLRFVELFPPALFLLLPPPPSFLPPGHLPHDHRPPGLIPSSLVDGRL